MNVIQTEPDGPATIEFTREEIGILGLVGLEFTQGAFSPDDEDWEDLVPWDRERVIAFFDQLP